MKGLYCRNVNIFLHFCIFVVKMFCSFWLRYVFWAMIERVLGLLQGVATSTSKLATHGKKIGFDILGQIKCLGCEMGI